jgi:hypothetical protein
MRWLFQIKGVGCLRCQELSVGVRPGESRPPGEATFEEEDFRFS